MEKRHEIIITLRGKPAARLCPIEQAPLPSVWEVGESVLARHGESENGIEFPERKTDAGILFYPSP